MKAKRVFEDLCQFRLTYDGDDEVSVRAEPGVDSGLTEVGEGRCLGKALSLSSIYGQYNRLIN